MNATCPLDQDEVEALLTSCKYGMSLEEISEVLSAEVGTVISVLTETTGITAKKLKMIYILREKGKSLEMISDIAKVPMSSLMMISAGGQSSHLEDHCLTQGEVSVPRRGEAKGQVAAILSVPKEESRQRLVKRQLKQLPSPYLSQSLN
jgi:hypothetical protein